jgi:hypothetical protein
MGLAGRGLLLRGLNGREFTILTALLGLDSLGLGLLILNLGLLARGLIALGLSRRRLPGRGLSGLETVVLRLSGTVCLG